MLRNTVRAWSAVALVVAISGCGESETARQQRADNEKAEQIRREAAAREADLRDEEHQKVTAKAAALHAIFKEANALSASKKLHGVLPNELNGKAIIFAQDGSIHAATKELDLAMQGSSDDEDLFVFLVINSFAKKGKLKFATLTKEGKLGSPSIPSVIQVVMVRIIDWKAKKIVGTFNVTGAEPERLSMRITTGDRDPSSISGPDPNLIAWVVERFGQK